MPERRVFDSCIAFMNSAALDPGGFAVIADKLHERLPADIALFMDQLKNVPDLAPFITGSARARLQQRLVAHLRAILSPELASDFTARSFGVGTMHAEIGLPPHWYLMAYGWFLMREVGIIVAECQLRPHQLERALKGLILRAFLDMTCSIQAYEEGMLAKHRDAVKLEDDIQGLKTLADIVGQVNDVAYDLACLSKNTYDGVAHAQEIAADSEKLFAASYNICTRTEDAAEEAIAADSCAAKGRQEVFRIARAMHEAAAAVDDTVGRLDELAKVTEQGGRILALSDGIARQAGELATEATSRAETAVGEQLKALAATSASATVEIGEQVAAIETGTRAIHDAVKRAHTMFAEGKHSAEQARNTMEEISRRFSVAAEKMAQIKEFLSEQSKIAYSIAHCVDDVSHTNNESDARLQAAADKLSSSNEQFMQRARSLLHEHSPRSLCEMAKVDHAMLIKQVVDVLMGYRIWPASQMHDHTQCQHSEWLATQVPPEVRTGAAYQSLEEPHGRVHALARKVLEAHEASDRVAALAALSELRDANAELFKALEALSEDLKQQRTAAPGHVAA